MTYKLPKDKITHGIVIFDPHFPFEDKQSYKNVMNYVYDSQPDIFVFGGDIVDLDLISNKSAIRQVEGRRLKHDFDHAVLRLEYLNNILPDATKIALEGNHDERMERYIDDHPETEGILEVPNMLKLEELGWNWIPSWRTGQLLTVGKANILHGNYTSINHARKMVDNYGVNVLYGHTHDVQRYSKVLMGDNSTIMAQSCGFLGRYDMAYMKGNPTNWQQAFLDIYWMPNGHFWHNVVPIFNHQFVVNGKLYK